jgi:hypothetical protein
MSRQTVSYAGASRNKVTEQEIHWINNAYLLKMELRSYSGLNLIFVSISVISIKFREI